MLEDSGTPSLPPGVNGKVKGEARVVIDTVRWNVSPAPSSTQVRLKWWGDGNSRGTLFRPCDGTELRLSATSLCEAVD